MLLFCFSVWLLSGRAGAAQALPSPSRDDYVVQMWNTDSGLPDSTVTSLAQTQDGFL